jgi:hypothetical protein
MRISPSECRELARRIERGYTRADDPADDTERHEFSDHELDLIAFVLRTVADDTEAMRVFLGA